MGWVANILAMLASACLTLAGIHLVVWSRNRRQLGGLVFACAAVGIAEMAAGDLELVK